MVSKIRELKLCSITIDKNTNFAQLLLLIRDIDEKFFVIEELADMWPLKETRTCSDISFRFLKSLSTLKVSMNTCLTKLWKYRMQFDFLHLFREFLDFMQFEYTDVLYYIKMRWLNAGRVFERVFFFKRFLFHIWVPYKISFTFPFTSVLPKQFVGKHVHR